MLALQDQALPEITEIAEALEQIDAIVAGRSPQLLIEPAAGERAVLLDRGRTVRALQNLIVNALEHGSGPVEIGVSAGNGSATVTVANQIAPVGDRLSDPRRGYGLEIAAQAAEEAGGRLEFLEDGSNALATLELGLGAARPEPVGG